MRVYRLHTVASSKEKERTRFGSTVAYRAMTFQAGNFCIVNFSGEVQRMGSMTKVNETHLGEGVTRGGGGGRGTYLNSAGYFVERRGV